MDKFRIDPKVTRIDLERLTDTGVIVRQWNGEWIENSKPDMETWEEGSVSYMLADFEKQGFTVEMASAFQGRALRGRIDRVDIIHDGTNWHIRKFPYGWSAKTRPIHTRTATDIEVLAAVEWMREQNWAIAEWEGGYRGWRGEMKPVRDRAAILSMRRRANDEKRNFNSDFAFYF